MIEIYNFLKSLVGPYLNEIIIFTFLGIMIYLITLFGKYIIEILVLKPSWEILLSNHLLEPIITLSRYTIFSAIIYSAITHVFVRKKNNLSNDFDKYTAKCEEKLESEYKKSNLLSLFINFKFSDP